MFRNLNCFVELSTCQFCDSYYASASATSAVTSKVKVVSSRDASDYVLDHKSRKKRPSNTKIGMKVLQLGGFIFCHEMVTFWQLN